MVINPDCVFESLMEAQEKKNPGLSGTGVDSESLQVTLGAAGGAVVLGHVPIASPGSQRGKKRSPVCLLHTWLWREYFTFSRVHKMTGTRCRSIHSIQRVRQACRHRYTGRIPTMGGADGRNRGLTLGDGNRLGGCVVHPA